MNLDHRGLNPTKGVQTLSAEGIADVGCLTMVIVLNPALQAVNNATARLH